MASRSPTSDLAVDTVPVRTMRDYMALLIAVATCMVAMAELVGLGVLPDIVVSLGKRGRNPHEW